MTDDEFSPVFLRCFGRQDVPAERVDRLVDAVLGRVPARPTPTPRTLVTLMFAAAMLGAVAGVRPDLWAPRPWTPASGVAGALDGSLVLPSAL